MIARAVLLAAAALAAAAGLAAPAPAAPPATASFMVKGDWGTGSAAQAAVTRRMCGEARRSRPAFVATTGDNFYLPDGVATRANYWAPERCLRALRIPWRAAWGNHDLAGTATAEVLGARRRHYAVSEGPVRLIVLDGNAPEDPRQVRFLRAELRDAAEPVRIVVTHQPLHTSGIHGPSEAARRAWGPLIRAGRVALVLQGHNHMYERLEVDGTTYVTTGGGGAQLYPCVRPTPGLRRCAFAHHFLRVDASAAAVTVRAITPAGVTLDRVRIPVP